MHPRDWIRGTFRFSFASIAEVFFVDMCTYQIDTLGIYRGVFFFLKKTSIGGDVENSRCVVYMCKMSDTLFL